MIVLIRCFSCGKPIAHLYKQFKERVEAGEPVKQVLDELGLDRYCCRAALIGQTDTLQLVNKFKKF